jgi:hypothetical protein
MPGQTSGIANPNASIAERAVAAGTATSRISLGIPGCTVKSAAARHAQLAVQHDGQIFSDTGIPVVLFMENYDINRVGYHDTRQHVEHRPGLRGCRGCDRNRIVARAAMLAS